MCETVGVREQCLLVSVSLKERVTDRAALCDGVTGGRTAP